MKVSSILIIALSLTTPALAKLNKPEVIEWHGSDKPSDKVPEWIGGTTPKHVKYYQAAFAKGKYQHRSDIDGLNSRAQMRRSEGVASPPPPPNWDDENTSRVHYPPTCDISDEQTNNRLFDSVASGILMYFLEMNGNTTVTIDPGTWLSIGIKGFIIALNNGEDGHGVDGKEGSSYTVPLSYIHRALEFHSHCQKYAKGNGRENTGWVGWPFCVHDEGGRPWEICGDKKQILGWETEVFVPGSLDGTSDGAHW